MPYLSKRQARWANATGQRFAKRWNKLTNFGALPEQKDSAATGMAIPPTGNHALFNQPGIQSRAKRRKVKQCTCNVTTKAATGAPGELIEPGVRRIRGNLCNVHGKYGPCDKALSGKKPKKGRQPTKPKQTPEQRATQRQQQRQERADAVAAQMRDSDTGLSPSGVAAMRGLASGQQPSGATADGLVQMGLAERGLDGSVRMTPTGRAAMNAMASGDYQRAVDTIARAGDAAATRRSRRAAAAKRTQDAAGKRTANQIGRELAKREQPAKAPAKRAASGGSKKPQPKTPSGMATRRRRSRGLSGTAAPSVSSGGSKKPVKPVVPKPEKPAKAPAKQVAPALQAAADKLSQGATLSDTDTNALIRNGLARLNKDGELILTAAGMRATVKESPAHTGVMIALYPDPAAAKQIAAQKGVTEPIDQLHLTLAFLGDSSETALATNKDKVVTAVKQWATQKGQPLEGTINGIGRFFHSEDDNTNAVFVSPDVPGLPEMRQSLVEWIEQSGFDYAQNHGFTPHITVAYVPIDAPTPSIRIETPITFDRVTLAWGDERYDYPLGTVMKDASFRIFKDAAGNTRWLAITTTAYEDKDSEIISTKAIGGAVALGDKTNQRGPLRYWHVPGLDIGDCDFQAQGGPGGRFLIEGGTFRSKAYAALGQQLADAGYQMSPGFIHQRDQPRDGVYDDIVIFERSAVPHGRAANHYTTLTAKEDKVLTPEKAAEYREKAAGNAEALALLDTLLATTAKEDATAQDRKVAYKEATLPQEIEIGGVVYAVKAFTPASAEQAGETEIADAETEQMDDGEPDGDEGMDDAAFAQMIAQAVIQAITPLLDIEKKMAGHMADLKGTLGGYAQQKDDATATQAQQIAALEAKLKELTGDLPSSVMNGAAQVYRASQSPATRLTTQAETVMKEQISQVPAGITDPTEIAAYQLIFGSN